eukprot:TRINITY_DN102495_c0_g1_i1.p1 TRINITY_DN102495_c0_g1~~TRINITY_DN102495_c0_g1_i1.p1  ORF type:complete len:264 (+),score=52.87 TRINITY_DN102495_c0_g1_i1:107-898(+)
MASLASLCSGMLQTERTIYPREYLAAIAELLSTSLVGSGIITWIFNPKQLEDNPIKRMVGFNDPCVVWDAAPALYFAFIIFAPMIFLGFRYWQMDSQRALQSPKLTTWQKHSICVVNFMFGMSMCLVMGIFVVTPMDGTLHSMWLHAGFFLQLVIVLMFTMAMNFFEARWNGETVEAWRWAGLLLHVVCTLNFGVGAGIGIYTYKNDGVPVLNPTYLMCTDYAWFLSMPVCSVCMPKDAPVHVEVTWHPVKLNDEETPIGART